MLAVCVLGAIAAPSAHQTQAPATQTPAAQTPQTPPAPSAPASSRIPESVRSRETVANDLDADPRVDNEPLDPSFKGFLPLPGTATRIKFGGYARVDLIHDFQPIDNHDEFVVSSIPVTVTAGFNNTEVQARQTRFNFELRRSTPQAADLRALFEFDFFGSSGDTTPNLRHAYGQYLNVLAGFTTTTFEDVDARPDILDHEGPPARIAVRQAQFRYTMRLPDRQSLAIAMEQPKSDIPSSVNGQTVTAFTPWPDVIARYRLAVHRGHLQVSGILRRIAGFVGNGTQAAQVTGFGLTGSTSLLVYKRDTLVFQASGGQGLARYVKDISGHGLDLALDEQGVAQAPAVAAALMGIQHLWTDRLRSTLSLSFDQIENFASQPGSTYHRAIAATLNLIFKPVPAITTGVEYDFGQFDVKDGRHNSDNRLQFIVQYDLVR